MYIYIYIYFTTCSELRKVLFLAPQSVGFLFVYEISLEPLLKTDLCQIRMEDVWSLARTSLKVTFKGQGYQGQNTTFFRPFGGLRAFYV